MHGTVNIKYVKDIQEWGAKENIWNWRGESDGMLEETA